jgi:L-iditol 2-dehydrogenase
MKALYFIGDRQTELRDIPIPTPGPSEYLIQVKSTGICGSDFEGYMGKTGRRLPPMIQGHELAGIITKAPPGGAYTLGQTVTVFPKPFCGECEFCKRELQNVCPAGICMGVMDRNGSMCEYIVVDERYVLPYTGIDFNHAAMTEPLAVAWRAVHKITDSEMQEYKTFLVVGAGTIGLLVVALLRYRNAHRIIVSDASEYRLSVALQMGAHETVNVKQESVADRVKTLTEGRMCDVSIEAVGIGATARDSLDALRIGGTAVWIGNAQRIIEIDMQRIVTREISIRGTYVYNFSEFVQSLRFLENNTINIDPVMTHVYPLVEGVQVFKDLENNGDGSKIKVFLEA